MSEQRCRAGELCVALTSSGAAITARPLCHGCVDVIEEQLGQLPDLQLALRSLLKNSIVPQGGGAKVSGGSTEASTPINLHALTLIDTIDDVLDWVGGVRIADLINRPTQEVAGRQLDGTHIALLVNRVWRQAEQSLGFQRAWFQRMAPCPKCDLRTLGSFSGSDVIQCSNCGGAMSRDEYIRICTIKSTK